MSYKDFHPCLPGEGRYARPKDHVHPHHPGWVFGCRWVHTVHPMKLKTDVEEVVHLLPAHQRKSTETYRH